MRTVFENERRRGEAAKLNATCSRGRGREKLEKPKAHKTDWYGEARRKSKRPNQERARRGIGPAGVYEKTLKYGARK